MERLLIQFTDAEITDFRWARHDEDSGSAQLDWQLAAEEQLTEVAAQNPLPLVFVIPQQCVYLTRVELPEKASRQVLSAIEYQVEDRLAQDIESQHVALGDTAQNPISLAVVDRAIMTRCLELAQRHGLRLVQIVPELFLCPWREGDSVNLTEGYDGCLLRYGDYSGIKCNAQALPAMLELIKREIEIDSIRYLAAEADATPTLAGYNLEREALASTTLGIDTAPLINLQQRDYQLSSPWLSLGRAWKWVGLIFAALIVIGAYNKAMALQDLEQELSEVRTQQYTLLKPYLPQSVKADDNLKKHLIDRLKALQASQREQGFLKLLLDFTRARSAYADVDIGRIVYQGRQLNIDISSQQLKSIEALHQALLKQGLQAKLEGLNIKPELISGRLVLLGGDDA